MLRNRRAKLILAICIGLYLFQFYFVCRYAVDIPYWDEWESFRPDQLPAGFSLSWLFAQHNEHRLVTTKLSIWLLYHLNGWDLVVHQVLNFLFYGLLLIWIAWFVRKVSPPIASWIQLSFMIFLLSTISFQNHVMGYQSQVHFWLLSFLIATYFLFHPSQTWLALMVGCLASTLSIYSLASGVVSTVTVLLVFCCFKSLRAFRATAQTVRKREFLQLAAVIALTAPAILLWFVGYQKPATASASTLLDTNFWDYYFNLVAFGFGVDKLSQLAGVVFFLFVTTPLAALLLSRKGNLRDPQWALVATTIAILAVLASIAAGRSGLGTSQSRNSRYAEFGMTIIPFSMAAWGYLCERKKRLQTLIIVGLWVLFMATFWDNYRFKTYHIEHYRRIAGLQCVKKYYSQGGDALCPTIYPGSLASKLEEAKKLNASFYRTLIIDDPSNKP